MFNLSTQTQLILTLAVLAIAAVSQAPRLWSLGTYLWGKFPKVSTPTTSTPAVNHDSCRVEAVRLCEALDKIFREHGGDVSTVPFAEAIKLHDQAPKAPSRGEVIHVPIDASKVHVEASL